MRSSPEQTAIVSRLTVRADAWMRASYWWFFAAIGAFTPFITLHYQQLGFSGAEIGVLAAIPPVATALLAPVWGSFADTRSAHRLLLRTSLALAAIVAVLLMRATSFTHVLGLVILLGVLIAPIPSLVDSFGVTLSEQLRLPYGQLRVWGSLGYTFTAWSVGWWMGHRVTAFFLLAYALTLFLTLVSTAGLPRLTAGRSTPIWQGISSVAGNRSLLLMLLVTYIVSSGAGAMYNYFGIYLKDIGGSASLLGAALAVAALSELPVMTFGSRLMERLRPRRMLVLAIGVYLVRFVCYGVITDPRWILPVQLLHGLSFAMYLMASVTLAHRLAGRDLAATAQGLLTAVSFGLGSLTGSLGGGLLLDSIGTMNLFRLSAALMLVALTVLLAGLRALDRAENREQAAVPT